MKAKHLLWGAALLIFAACSDDITTVPETPGVQPEESVPNMASYIVGQWDQSRVINTGYYRAPQTKAGDDTYNWPAEMQNFPITLPTSDYIEPDNSGKVSNSDNKIVVVPAGFSGILNFNWGKPAAIYISAGATVTGITQINGREGDEITTIYICEGGSFSGNFNSGKINIYNEGILDFLEIPSSNIQNIYNNGGAIEIDTKNSWFNNSPIFYSKDGTFVLNGEVNLNSKITCNHILTINGDLYYQDNNQNTNVCAFEVSGKITLNQNGFIATYVKCNELNLYGRTVTLRPNGLIKAQKLDATNGGNQAIRIDATGMEESPTALVEVDELSIRNIQGTDMSSVFHQGVYLNVNKIINNGNEKLEQYFVATTNGINNASMESYPTPSCDTKTTTPDPDPEPSLDQVEDITSPVHNHNSDKFSTDRHLSATSIAYNPTNNTFYASYHMRGLNYDNDIYKNDETEGCIESFSFNNEGKIELKKFMWTYEFDFNHIIYDETAGAIVTVGHKDKLKEGATDEYVNSGAIIGRLTNLLDGPSLGDNENGAGQNITTYNDFEWMYLITDKPLRENGVMIDYENAGDGNCVERVGDEYFVATSAGYGRINAKELVRVKHTVPTFISTPGSAKYLVTHGDNMSLLHLNTRPDVTESAESPASIVTVSKDNFAKVEATPVATPGNNVQPVDGKNVLAYDNGTYYACLSNGGLYIGNGENAGTIIPFNRTDETKSPVNGVAVDDKYIYVANGCHVTILDKNNPTAKPIIDRRISSDEMSANFVYVHKINGERTVFVAYGQGGIKVFKFFEG